MSRWDVECGRGGRDGKKERDGSSATLRPSDTSHTVAQHVRLFAGWEYPDWIWVTVANDTQPHPRERARRCSTHEKRGPLG